MEWTKTCGPYGGLIWTHSSCRAFLEPHALCPLPRAVAPLADLRNLRREGRPGSPATRRGVETRPCADFGEKISSDHVGKNWKEAVSKKGRPKGGCFKERGLGPFSRTWRIPDVRFLMLSPKVEHFWQGIRKRTAQFNGDYMVVVYPIRPLNSVNLVEFNGFNW